MNLALLDLQSEPRCDICLNFIPSYCTKVRIHLIECRTNWWHELPSFHSLSWLQTDDLPVWKKMMFPCLSLPNSTREPASPSITQLIHSFTPALTETIPHVCWLSLSIWYCSSKNLIWPSTLSSQSNHRVVLQHTERKRKPLSRLITSLQTMPGDFPSITNTICGSHEIHPHQTWQMLRDSHV